LTNIPFFLWQNSIRPKQRNKMLQNLSVPQHNCDQTHTMTRTDHSSDICCHCSFSCKSCCDIQALTTHMVRCLKEEWETQAAKDFRINI